MTNQPFLPPNGPAGRAEPDVLGEQQCKLRATPLVRTLLEAVPDLVVVLNRQRQIVLANDRLAALVNQHGGEVLGMRLGEAIRCSHASGGPDGCGTTEFCRVCGAARTMLKCQEEDAPTTGECRILRALGMDPAALDLRVWARPLEVEGETFTVFVVRDIGDEKRRQALERMFFHDLLNAASGLHGLLDVWPELEGEEAAEMEQLACHLAAQLLEEIETQRDLAAAERGELDVSFGPVDVADLLGRLCGLYRHHVVALGKTVAPPKGKGQLHTSAILLRRVLGNLLKNALEASRPGQTVTAEYSAEGGPTFSVHNESAMPEEVQLQMFQRSFSTKGGNGRGLGTYSVKLLTERYLHGTVWFTSNPAEGTTFFVRLPGV